MSYNTYILTFQGYYKLFDTITTKPGIYCLYAQGQGNDGGVERKLLFVGMTTGSLRDTITANFYNDTWNEALEADETLCASAATYPFETGELYGLTEETELNRVEAAMVYQHRPPHNTQHKEHFPFPDIEIILKGDCDQLVTHFKIPV